VKIILFLCLVSEPKFLVYTLQFYVVNMASVSSVSSSDDRLVDIGTPTLPSKAPEITENGAPPVDLL
jgi:hypothetical protein